MVLYGSLVLLPIHLQTLLRYPALQAALTRAPDTVGVVAVQDRPVLSGMRDVVAHAGQPLQRIEGLEVTPERRVHAWGPIPAPSGSCHPS